MERIAQIARPLPGRRRARFGAVAASTLIAAATFSVWAAKPPQSAAAENPAVVYVVHRTVAARAASAPALPAADVAHGDVRDPAGRAATSKGTADPARSAESTAAKNPARGGNEIAAAARIDPVPSGTSVFVPPRVTHHWKPPYPSDAYNAGTEGEAQVLVTIAADGTLRNARIVGSSRDESLDRASLEAARHYSYAAALKGGLPVDAQAIVAIDWSINPGMNFTVASGLGRSAAEPGLPSSGR